jgi:hypothetical protein
MLLPSCTLPWYVWKDSTGKKATQKHPILMKYIEKQETVTGEAFHPMSWTQKNDLLMANKERGWTIKNPEADIIVV